jgi:UDP-glucose 4-epimerase
MNVLVTGGAGYIGSIVTERLIGKQKVIVVDNCQQGHRESVLPQAEFVSADIGNAKALDEIFKKFNINAVIHMAGETVVEFSLTDPKRYFQNNIIGGINLLNTMLKNKVNKIIFSSSASTYGEPHSVPIDEIHPKAPINSYGETKLMFERVLYWYARAYGIKFVCFRYFNAAGATELLGEDHRPETHLIPNILKAALDKNKPVSIFGTDYPTPDGSCVRDYVHVVDIAQAHILALEKINNVSGRSFNLGNGEGYSVLEVVKTVEKVAGTTIPVILSPRRPGDPATLVASSKLAEQELGWKPEFPALEDIIRSAWQWQKRHPDGYGK